jgi:hypothetical protein
MFLCREVGQGDTVKKQLLVGHRGVTAIHPSVAKTVNSHVYTVDTTCHFSKRKVPPANHHLCF